MTSRTDATTDPLAEYDEMLSQNCAPDPGEFCARYPERPSLLRRIEVLRGLRGDLDLLLAPKRRDETECAPSIDGFRIIRPLGRGGMGRVFIAEQMSPRRLCALKIVRRESPPGLERFRREA